MPKWRRSDVDTMSFRRIDGDTMSIRRHSDVVYPLVWILSSCSTRVKVISSAPSQCWL